MFEEGLPWYVPTGQECHAAGYGFFHSFTRKGIVAWEDIPKETLSPENEKDIQEKYHYYAAGFYLPRVVLISIVGIRFIAFTDVFNSKEAVMGLVHLLFGM